MGSPDTQYHRFDNEGPQQHVTIARAFWLGKYEVTVGEFKAFVEGTGYQRPRSPQMPHIPTDFWRRPGYEQTDRHPVVNMVKEDAQAYVAWLRRTTGLNYRLPSEAEWEYAARAGTTAAYFWGDDSREACSYANLGDLAFWQWAKGPRGDIVSCNDGHAQPSPVGTFQPNDWGFHDMLGNAAEWSADCWNDNHAGQPANGQARTSGDCYRSALRGGSWLSGAGGFHAAGRVDTRIGYTDSHVGFRVARDE
jgi:formylglycine-generating enzyme required for sulfatase activity